jgi:AcrR family transcriptional regulator
MAERSGAERQQGAGEERLPPGRHGLSRETVAENQRERLLNGIVDAVAEHGFEATTIGRITDAAKISRRTFYEHFRGKEDCFLAAYAMVDEHVRNAMLAASGPADSWPEQVRDRLAALLEFLSRDAAVARFYLVEPLAAGGEIAARYRDAMQLLAEAVRPPAAVEIDVEVRDQVLMGGIATLISRRLKAGDAAGLPKLLPELVELTLAPYVGREEARRFARSEAHIES